MLSVKNLKILVVTIGVVVWLLCALFILRKDLPLTVDPVSLLISISCLLGTLLAIGLVCEKYTSYFAPKKEKHYDR
jgi:uncharacterized membrane protein YciS (DUF1049 family)